MGGDADDDDVGDERCVFFRRLAAHGRVRAGLDALYAREFRGGAAALEWLPANREALVGPEWRQRGLDGAPAADLEALYEVAELAVAPFRAAVGACLRGIPGVTLEAAPLKGIARARAKAATDCVRGRRVSLSLSRSARAPSEEIKGRETKVVA